MEDLRQLMVEKRRKVRREHLERFKKSGRVVKLASELKSEPLENVLYQIRPEVPAYDHLHKQQKLKRVLDRLLLAIEVVAVLGLIFIIYTGIKILKNLNSEFSQSLTPALQLTNAIRTPVILPSGHTPPNSPGGSQPNEAEIPSHLRSLYQTMVSLPTPTQGSEQATHIQIPAIGVDSPIVQGDGWDELKKGVAQHIGSADPGQMGNMVLSAHNDVYGEIFRDLDQLEAGDEIIIKSPNSAFTYIITGIQIVDPTDVEVMGSTKEPVVTLISCYPYWVDTQRIVVRASLKTGND